MSRVSDAAVVRMMLADYVASDPAGKISMIGGGLGIIGPGTQIDALEGRTTILAGTPHGLFTSVAVGPDLYGAQAVVELTLEDEGGDVVRVPPPDSPRGDPQEVRITSPLTFAIPEFPANYGVPKGALLSRTQWVLMFPAGLALAPGMLYRWRITIDGVGREDWTERFFVPDFPE